MAVEPLDQNSEVRLGFYSTLELLWRLLCISNYSLQQSSGLSNLKKLTICAREQGFSGQHLRHDAAYRPDVH